MAPPLRLSMPQQRRVDYYVPKEAETLHLSLLVMVLLPLLLADLLLDRLDMLLV